HGLCHPLNFEFRMADCGFRVSNVELPTKVQATQVDFPSQEQNPQSAIRNPTFLIRIAAPPADRLGWHAEPESGKPKERPRTTRQPPLRRLPSRWRLRRITSLASTLLPPMPPPTQ